MEELNSTQNVVVGIVAGCIQCILDHPLITLKNTSQQKLPISFHPKFLYRGTMADMMSLSSLTAIQFLGTGAIKQIIIKQKRSASLTGSEILLSSLGGGVLSGIVCSPWELIMIQQQRFGGNLYKNATKINQQNLKHFFRGMIPSMSREGIFTMGYLGITPLLEQYSNDNTENNIFAMFACSMISGGVATLLSHPFDTIKTCMQGDLNKDKYKGVYQTFCVLYKEHGLRRIYAGASFRFGVVAMSFFVFNRVIELIAPKIYPSQFIAKNQENI